MRRPKPKFGCCNTIKYIIPVTGYSKTDRLPSNKTELDLDRFSNSISQWLLRLKPEKWWEETEAKLENIRKINVITGFISRMDLGVKFNLLNTK